MRSFAITLHFFSPRAYEYVRGIYLNKLPHQRTIRKWYQSIDGKPGCTSESLKALKIRTAAKGGKIICNLVMDEMSIRQEIVYDESTKKYSGYCDFGNPFAEDDDDDIDKEQAKEALVFLVVAVNDHFKIPVAYYFVNSLNATEKANIVKEVLIFLNEADIEISSLTFDGNATNIAVAKCLGADLSIAKLKPWFNHPVTKKLVCIFLDICHMLKLLRNTLALNKTFFDSDGREVKWEYFEKLEQLQTSEGMRLGNRLTNRHIFFENQKMKTSLAAQTFSHSVAAAMQYLLNTGDPEFAGCEATIDFTLKVNNLFDILNCKSKFGSKFKRPFSKETFAEYKLVFDEMTEYLKGLYYIDKKKKMDFIVDTQIRTGYVGFVVGIISIQKLYNRYVDGGTLEYLLSFKFSQDHLEMLFSALRGRGGFNNNPNCTQFTAAYKKMLVRNEIRGSEKANCIDDGISPSIFTVSSSIVSPDSKNTECDFEGTIHNDLDILEMSPYVHDTVTYISGFVEKTLRKCVHKCSTCTESLNKLECYEDIGLIKCKDFGGPGGGLIKPKKDVVTICQIAEMQVSLYEAENRLKSVNFYKDLLMQCFQCISDDIFLNFFEEDNPTHLFTCPYDREYLIKCCLDMYLKIKLHHIGKKMSLQEKPLRQKYNKLILFSGQ